MPAGFIDYFEVWGKRQTCREWAGGISEYLGREFPTRALRARVHYIRQKDPTLTKDQAMEQAIKEYCKPK